LARHLDIGVVAPEDREILTNIYIRNTPAFREPAWERFFSVALLDDAMHRLARLPLPEAERYRKAQFWMDSPHLRLQRVIGAVHLVARERTDGPTFHLIFADFVWLYTLALWEACEALVSTGASRLEAGLRGYLTGGEAGLVTVQRMQRVFEQLAKRLNVEASISAQPPYFEQLAELLARLLRRPDATARIGRRAEWLVIGQIIGGLGLPPWRTTEDDIYA